MAFTTEPRSGGVTPGRRLGALRARCAFEGAGGLPWRRMKITDVTSFPVFNGQRNNLFVVVDTDESIYGVGESGLSGRELAVMGAIEHLKPLLIGQDPSRIEHLWQVMLRGGFFPANRVIGSAISAIDIALWDIQGKALSVPIYKLLGGLVRDRVVCYPHNQPAHEGDVQALVDSCQQTKGRGLEVRALGAARARRRARARAARCDRRSSRWRRCATAVGDDIGICFDVHTRLDLPDAVRLCRASEEFEPFFMEDPLRSENPHRLPPAAPADGGAAGGRRAVRHQVGVPRD